MKVVDEVTNSFFRNLKNTINPKNYVPKCPKTRAPLKLPKNVHGERIPSSNTPHTQLGYRGGRNGGYRQTMEWGYDGTPIKMTDWTTHGRNHPYPHDHYFLKNPTGGSMRRGPPKPFEVIHE